MTLLLAGVLVGMYVVSYGSIFISNCMLTWWMYIWWLIVLFVTTIDSWVQLPFDHYAKLYLTDTRVRYTLSGGAAVLGDTNTNLRQLSEIPHAAIEIPDTSESEPARNTLLIIVSIARVINDLNGFDTSALRYCIQVFSQIASLTVYVFSTAQFASIALLAFPMAEMVLMLIVGAGVLSRVTASKIVQGIDGQDSMIHIIARNEADARQVLDRVFRHQLDEGQTKFQIELDGHVFLEGKRVIRRSIWWRRILGLLARPYDFRKHKSFRNRRTSAKDNSV